jgi:hypothetical protein
MKSENNKLRFNDFLVGILLILLVLANLFPSSVASNFDEVSGILSFLTLVIIFFISKFRYNVIRIFLGILLLIIIGIISNVLSNIDVQIFSICVDILTIGKPFFVFLAIFHLSNENTFVTFRNILNFPIKFFLVIVIVFAILNQFHIVQMNRSIVFGFPDYAFIFGFPFILAAFVYSLLPFILNERKKLSKQPFVVLSLIIIAITLKTQSIFLLLIFVGLYLFLGKVKSFNILYIIFPGIIAILVAWPTINFYFFSNIFSPRQIMIHDAINLSKTYFPFGSGLATFASPIAGQHYSPLYFLLGYSTLDGMGLDGNIQYLNDNFLASIIGQFGIIGLIVFGYLMIQMIALVIQKGKQELLDIYLLAGIVSLFGVSLSSSYLTGALGTLVFGIFGLTYAYRHGKGRNNERI